MPTALTYPRITHDHFFKKLMARDEVAREFLEEYLPQSVLTCVDLDSIQQLATGGKGYTKENR